MISLGSFFLSSPSILRVALLRFLYYLFVLLIPSLDLFFFQLHTHATYIYGPVRTLHLNLLSFIEATLPLAQPLLASIPTHTVATFRATLFPEHSHDVSCEFQICPPEHRMLPRHHCRQFGLFFRYRFFLDRHCLPLSTTYSSTLPPLSFPDSYLC